MVARLDPTHRNKSTRRQVDWPAYFPQVSQSSYIYHRGFWLDRVDLFFETLLVTEFSYWAAGYPTVQRIHLRRNQLAEKERQAEGLGVSGPCRPMDRGSEPPTSTFPKRQSSPRSLEAGVMKARPEHRWSHRRSTRLLLSVGSVASPPFVCLHA